MSSRENDRDVDDLIARIMDQMPPYDGRDANTANDWYCKGCFKSRAKHGVRLLVCSRCRTVRYCSIKCQKEDLDEHRPTCRKIHSLMTKMELQAAELREWRGWFGNAEPENMFETQVGHFWSILDTRDYCRARSELAAELTHLAHWYEAKPLLEMALGHQLELLRLNASDNVGMRDAVPFTLLSLNRDDDCYSFMKYWMPILEEGLDVADRHKNTSPGDWIYSRDGDKREDLLEVCNCDESYFPLSFLAALCIIKLRIIAAHEAKLKQVETLGQTSAGRTLGDTLDHVERFHTEGNGESSAVINEQERHVQRYFWIMQQNNPSLLPAIINPGPLKRQPQPNYIRPGTPSEAWEVLNRCNRHFIRIPGVEARIEGIVGKNPTYDYQISAEL